MKITIETAMETIKVTNPLDTILDYIKGDIDIVKIAFPKGRLITSGIVGCPEDSEVILYLDIEFAEILAQSIQTTIQNQYRNFKYGA